MVDPMEAELEKDIVRNEFNQLLREGNLDDWCPCGSNEEIDKAMYYYLTSGRRREKEYKKILKADEPLDLFCAYLATSFGWTEHGGSVGGSWLTGYGEEILKKFDEQYGNS